MLIISDLLDASEVAAYREALTKAQWHDGLATAGSLSQSVKQNEQVASQCELGQALADKLRQRLSQHPGELSIDTGFGVQEVKLPAGSLVLYATSRWHQVEPVTQGERVAAICWIQSLVAADAKRELLFDLDQSIQRLQQLPEARSEHRQLTGIYNNLLRQWAIT